MRRPIFALAFACGLLAAGACSTLGQRVEFSLAELTARCEGRGGTLQPTGATTGRPQTDFICRERTQAVARGGSARGDLNRAIDQSLRRGN